VAIKNIIQIMNRYVKLPLCLSFLFLHKDLTKHLAFRQIR